ncbi:MAG: flagellar M-ring protein FliF C-terminal domain-containing protein [Rhizomicrobium sp.]
MAAAVAALNPDRVAIVDDRGTLLAGGDDKSGPDAMAEGEEQHTSQFEDRLRTRIESIVGSVVGAGHTRVQVTADMNYNHTSETSETFDPDSKVVRSTQTVEQNASDTNANNTNAVSVASALPNAQNTGSTDSTKSSSGRTEETTNYEISKTTKTSTIDGGTVKRLSVAVVVDAAKDGDYKPRTPAEMKQIEGLVKSTMGFDGTRGDQVQVTSMSFARIDTGSATPAPAPLLGLDGSYWFKIIEAAIFGVTALLIGFFVARPLIQRMFSSACSPRFTLWLRVPVFSCRRTVARTRGARCVRRCRFRSRACRASRATGSMIDISRIEGQVRESAVRKVGEVVQAHPMKRWRSCVPGFTNRHNP